MKRIKYLFAALAVVSIQSCTSEILDGGNDANENANLQDLEFEVAPLSVLKVTDLEDFTCESLNDATSRSYVKNESVSTGKWLLWKGNEQISVFDSQFNNRQYTWKSTTNEKNGTAIFTGKAVGDNYGLAVFPYSTEYVYDERNQTLSGVSLEHAYTRTYTAPSSSLAEIGADFAETQSFINIAKYSGTSKSLFYTPCAVVKVTVPSGVVQMSIFANGGEAICGNDVVIDVSNRTSPKFIKVNDPYNYVTANTTTYPAGSALYFFVLPKTYSQGISIAAKDTNGNVKYLYTKTRSGKTDITLDANNVYDLTEKTAYMANLTVVPALINLGDAGQWPVVNLGGMYPTDTGNTYMWGDINPKHTDWKDYVYSDHTGTDQWTTKFTKYVSDDQWLATGKTKDNKTSLDSSDDAATQLYGQGYAIPTIDEYSERLVKNGVWNDIRMDGSDEAKICVGTNGRATLWGLGTIMYATRNRSNADTRYINKFHVGSVSVAGYATGTYPPKASSGDLVNSRCQKLPIRPFKK